MLKVSFRIPETFHKVDPVKKLSSNIPLFITTISALSENSLQTGVIGESGINLRIVLLFTVGSVFWLVFHLPVRFGCVEISPVRQPPKVRKTEALPT